MPVPPPSRRHHGGGQVSQPRARGGQAADARHRGDHRRDSLHRPDVRQVQWRASRLALRVALPQEFDDSALLSGGHLREVHRRHSAEQAGPPAGELDTKLRRGVALAEQVHHDAPRHQLGDHQARQTYEGDQGLPRHLRHGAARRVLEAQRVRRAWWHRVGLYEYDAPARGRDGLCGGRSLADGHRPRGAAGDGQPRRRHLVDLTVPARGRDPVRPTHRHRGTPYAHRRQRRRRRMRVQHQPDCTHARASRRQAPQAAQGRERRDGGRDGTRTRGRGARCVARQAAGATDAGFIARARRVLGRLVQPVGRALRPRRRGGSASQSTAGQGLCVRAARVCAGRLSARPRQRWPSAAVARRGPGASKRAARGRSARLPARLQGCVWVGELLADAKAS
mmetsp:Transcript_44065/g.129831  ORF Transcript_44065/g.129831 Transcript_44065/m.129831 type:complete len:394 (-) Transcript_44065:1905-3086(-)